MRGLCATHSRAFVCDPHPPHPWVVSRVELCRDRECNASRALVVLLYINMIQHPYHHALLYENGLASRRSTSRDKDSKNKMAFYTKCTFVNAPMRNISLQ